MNEEKDWRANERSQRKPFLHHRSCKPGLVNCLFLWHKHPILGLDTSCIAFTRFTNSVPSTTLGSDANCLLSPLVWPWWSQVSVPEYPRFHASSSQALTSQAHFHWNSAHNLRHPAEVAKNQRSSPIVSDVSTRPVWSNHFEKRNKIVISRPLSKIRHA